MAEEVKIETSPEPFRLKDGGEITIGGPGPSDLESAYQVFEVTIRDAFLKEGLVHLEEEISGEIRWKKKMLQEAVKMEGEVLFLVARMDERVIGTISFGPCGEIIRQCTDHELDGIGELGSLFVLPGFQDQGIGSRLIRALMHLLQENGTEKFCLDSGYSRAQKRWQRKFAAPWKTVEDYWGPSKDHMIWLCSVSDFLDE